MRQGKNASEAVLIPRGKPLHIPGAEMDDSGVVVIPKKGTSPDLKSVITARDAKFQIKNYLEAVIRECRSQLSGKGIVDLPGKEYKQFVVDSEALAPVTGIGKAKMRISQQFQSSKGSETRPTENVCECIEQNSKKVVLLGEPGSGKTVALIQLTLYYAEQALKAQGGMLPVFVPLGSFRGFNSLDSHIKAECMANIPKELSEELFEQDQILLIFDALNETDQDKHQEVVNYILRTKRFIVSCRLLDYEQELAPIKDVTVITILDLDPHRIKKAIETRFSRETASALWHAMGGSDHLLSYWDKLFQQDDQNLFWEPSRNEVAYTEAYEDVAWNQMHAIALLPICRNPLMLSMVCDLYDEEHRELPKNRGVLFEQFINHCLDSEIENIRQSRKQYYYSIESLKENTIKALRIVSGEIHQKKLGTGISSEMGEQALLMHMTVSEIRDGKRLARDAGILTQGKNEIRFFHQLFQEYFASSVMRKAFEDSSQNSASVFFKQTNWWETQGWEEPAVILAGILGNAGLDTVNSFLVWLATAQPELVIRCIERAGIPNYNLNSLGDDIKDKLRKMWVARLAQANDSMKSKVLISRALAKIGDTRPGVGIVEKSGEKLPKIKWIVIPSSPLQMSRFPITTEQFNLFIREGYIIQEIWDISDDSLQWHSEHPIRKISSQNRNEPIVDVTWYEAAAFCRWLSQKTGKHIRLPSETDWMQMYQSQDVISRTFDSIYPERIAVGIQDGKSTFVSDIAGGVWEWCSDIFENELSAFQSVDDHITTRILKGGSWRYSKEYGTAEYRFRTVPSFCRDDIGFRVACDQVIKQEATSNDD